MTGGCDVQINKFEPDQLDKMMLAAMQWNTEDRTGMEYNEVLIDSKTMVANFSTSIAAFVYGLSGRSDTPSDPGWAHWAYAQLLRAYGLESTPNRPLLLKADMSAKPGKVFTDVSGQAREYLRSHPLKELPMLWNESHAFREGASTPDERKARKLKRDERSRPLASASRSSKSSSSAAPTARYAYS